MTELAESLAEFIKKWKDLTKRARNGPRRIRNRSPEIFEITIAEVLTWGSSYLRYESAIVRDENNQIWIIPETKETGGLVNRYDLRPGMRLRLEVQETIWAKKQTRVYPL